MRTTLNLDEDILETAKSLARSQGRPLGRVISALARRGLAPLPQTATDDGLPVFMVPPDAAPITDETVRWALEDEG